MKGYIFLLVIAVVVCTGICLWVRKYYQGRMETAFQALLEKLDRAIGGEVQEVVYDESMDAAIAERLNRMVEIYGMNRDRAERERDIIKALISDVSHQVRTPLTNIMLYAGLLQEQELGSEALLLVNKIEKQSDKLDFFMKELVKSSYAEREMITIHPEMTSVEEMVNTACQMMEITALKKKIVFLQEGKDMLCYADKKWTIEALGNVLENAVKYSPENSQVCVRIVPYESFVCIEVRDQGIGISEEEQGMIFERFYRSKAVSDEPGFGIGLYLVREVLSKQGGYAKVKSELGKGSAVQLYLSRYEV